MDKTVSENLEERLREAEKAVTRIEERQREIAAKSIENRALVERLDSHVGQSFISQGKRIGEMEKNRLLDDERIKRLEFEQTVQKKDIGCLQTKAQRAQGGWAVIVQALTGGGIIGILLDRWFSAR